MTDKKESKKVPVLVGVELRTSPSCGFDGAIPGRGLLGSRPPVGVGARGCLPLRHFRGAIPRSASGHRAVDSVRLARYRGRRTRNENWPQNAKERIAPAVICEVRQIFSSQ